MSDKKAIKGTETEKNLMKAFAGESQAKNRYTFYAKIAREEGYEQIAAIFEETAINEEAHAKRFFSFLEGGDIEIIAAYPSDMGTTAENLRSAAHGENEEWTHLYPGFAEIAKQEGFPNVAAVFNLISSVEVRHEARFLKLLDNIEKEQVFKKEEKVEWKCRNCGYIHTGETAISTCPACLYPKAFFEVAATNY